MNEVVDKVQTRWLGAIDKFEPEIDREFLDKMKEAVNEVHKTEGFRHGKIYKARDLEDDWLTKSVQQTARIQASIPKYNSKSRVAVWDSWDIYRSNYWLFKVIISNIGIQNHDPEKSKINNNWW